MIYSDDIHNLINQWNLKLLDKTCHSEYSNAIFDCILDLQNLLKTKSEEDIIMQEYYKEMLADDYLASPEFHEQYAV